MSWLRVHLVNLLAVVAMLVVSVRTGLLSRPEVFPLGAELGEVANQLGLAYLAAWLFHWLVVMLPRQRQERNAYQSVGPLLLRIGISGWRIIDKLHRLVDEDSPQVPDARALGATLSRVDPSTAGIFDPTYTDLRREITPVEFIRALLGSVAESVTSVQPFLPQIDPLFTPLLHDLTTSDLFVLAPAIPPNNVRVPDMTAYAKPLLEYWHTSMEITALCRDKMAQYGLETYSELRLRSGL